MFRLIDLAAICGGEIIGGSPSAKIYGACLDSREVHPGDLFVAVKGLRVDGHDFVREALRRGAACALVERELSQVGPVVKVSSSLEAIQKLAMIHRARFSIPVIAVTGSSGKTTTKECIGIALSQVFQVRVGFRNWNNHLGVPLNLLRLTDQDQVLVIELGANHEGEIEHLAKMAQPSVGVITGIHPAHLKGFSNLEGVYRAKLELAEEVARRSGVMIAYGDDEQLVRCLKKIGTRCITFGRNPACDFTVAELANTDGTVEFTINGSLQFKLKGHGSFNVFNVAAAVATASHFNLDLNALSEAWCSLPPIENRFEVSWLDHQDVQIVDDSYNANPASFEHALDAFLDLSKNRRKIVVAGDMLELGESARAYHVALGKQFGLARIDVVVGVGEESRHVIDSFKSHYAEGWGACASNVEEAEALLKEHLKEGDSVLIKGSHGMGLHELKRRLFCVGASARDVTPA
jgi:UDP-N-acetylmuramoyl-tripeptide--D-alanyl-D-alanine ligase